MGRANRNCFNFPSERSNSTFNIPMYFFADDFGGNLCNNMLTQPCTEMSSAQNSIDYSCADF
ncbi:uncharacterized protein PHALS_15223 [Plasmopara halstedii]|uniref:Uncharacterized protein n=1 Tax=Plasmopara halstedii TaxID=4781 RepID=A0A0P1B4D0_PLAHL|nr:uncharacterized protein PHALS_15223 [Plasmopara halstedii]CEG49624.1 hypothetical protein PHALS_15223 [Plasmopara halstedii]|eukprot:XP_024585993.1 hypothetical protein PHALS_15223 [Plasmopara halstedii]